MTFRYKSLNVYPDTYERVKKVWDRMKQQREPRQVTIDETINEIMDVYDDCQKAANVTATEQLDSKHGIAQRQ